MFGYANNETAELMPLTISLSHKLVRDLATAEKSGKADFLRPDSKDEMTVEYEGGKPKRIEAVVSAQHGPDIT